MDCLFALGHVDTTDADPPQRTRMSSVFKLRAQRREDVSADDELRGGNHLLPAGRATLCQFAEKPARGRAAHADHRDRGERGERLCD